MTFTDRHCPTCWVAWSDPTPVSPCWSCGEPTDRNGCHIKFAFTNPHQRIHRDDDPDPFTL